MSLNFAKFSSFEQYLNLYLYRFSHLYCIMLPRKCYLRCFNILLYYLYTDIPGILFIFIIILKLCLISLYLNYVVVPLWFLIYLNNLFVKSDLRDNLNN